MSLLNYLEPQEIDQSPDELIEEEQPKIKDDSIELDEPVDES